MKIKITSVLDIVAIALVITGAFLLCLPAGIITAGVGLGVISVALDRRSDPKGPHGP